jgi:hypothetical protein
MGQVGEMLNGSQANARLSAVDRALRRRPAILLVPLMVDPQTLKQEISLSPPI